MRGTASDVFGIESETWLRKTVRLRRTVTSVTKFVYLYIFIYLFNFLIIYLFY